MNEEISQVIEEKFTRCPECRSFSVRQTTDLTIKDRIKSLLVPVTVHLCDNCSYRFVEHGSLLTGSLPRKCLVIATPILVVVILVVILSMAGGKEKKPGIKIEKEQEKPSQQITPAEKPETKPGEKKEDQAQEIQENQKPQQETRPITPTIAGEIVLGNSNRFGVNWKPLGEGVQITRLSPGSLKRAGLLKGDILVEVDGKKVIGEGMDLEIARDDVFYGKRTEVLIKVLRGEEILVFKMIKTKK
ncbi:MAG: hypothetical protein JSV88_30300 [Candidatus Aminicenantes bacterium]|nr:MAG: hypothetical protein JSV88_30300 [Candidatus Aminicenantes bacterium]